MKHFVLAGMLSLSAATSVLAQPPDANTQAILDALKGINNRLDTIEGRIDTIEGSGTAAGQASNVGGKNPPAGMEVKDGWNASAHLLRNGVSEPDALVYFTLPANEIRLNAHMDKTNTKDVVAYKAEAKFNAFEDGRYRFVIETGGRVYNVGCVGGLTIGTQSVISLGTTSAPSFVSEGLTLTGSADLSAGNYDITFDALCMPVKKRGYQQPVPQGASWRDTGFRFLVRGPNERDLRPLTDKELFHYEQKATQP